MQLPGRAPPAPALAHPAQGRYHHSGTFTLYRVAIVGISCQNIQSVADRLALWISCELLITYQSTSVGDLSAGCLLMVEEEIVSVVIILAY